MAADRTRVFITVDTEPTMAGAMEQPERYRPLFDPVVICDVEGRSEGLGFLTRTLGRHQMAATFFVEAMHPSYFGPKPMGDQVKALLEAGQDVQIHVHPEWLSWDGDRLDAQNRVPGNLSDIPEERLVEILGRARSQIEAWTGVRAVALRAGSFAANRALFRAMARCGLHLSSNLCIGSRRPPAEPELRSGGGVLRVEGVSELPVTCFTDPGPVGRGRFRPMQLTACSSGELIALLKQARRIGLGHVVILTHPFEFIKKTHWTYPKIKRNRLVQARLERLCTFLDRNRDAFEVATFGALAASPPDPERVPGALAGRTDRSLQRSLANGINDRVWAL